jgi:uncharacterized protein involved in response to NO
VSVATAERQRAWTGPAFLSAGFRPFFLAAGLWAIAAIAIWPAFFMGEVAIPTAFPPVDWHVHEMIFGYGAAVIAGFLLTAIPNWTGRLPVAGLPLGCLALLWVAGRIAIFFSGLIGPLLAAIVDAAFLLALAGVAAREVLAGKNTRNLKVVVLILLLAAANIGFHAESAVTGSASAATRAGLAVIIMLILVIGGRVVPSFTHNWLGRRGDPERPVSFGRADGIVMAVSALALLLWVVLPEEAWTAAPLAVAGLANLWRLSRWRGLATVPDRLVLVLHGGFFFAALGFLFAAAAILAPDWLAPGAALHVWAIGAIGTMTLAMMTRATLGHTGHALAASPGTQFVYLAVIVAMLARVAAGLWPEAMVPLLHAAATAWVAGFAGFAAIYGPMLVRPRPGREG